MSGSNPDPNGTGMSVSPQVVVLVCIFGTGAFVLLSYASTHYYFNRGPREDTSAANHEFDQAQYMRDVRVRYKDEIAGSFGPGRRWRDITEAKHYAQNQRSSGGGESGFS